LQRIEMFRKFNLISPSPKKPDMLSEHPTLNQAESVFLVHVRACIIAHLDDESFGVTELAAAVCLCRTQLFRRIKALTGRNAARYIHQVRIEEAKALLASTALSVAEIAWRCGFTDPSYLRRVFLLETGQTLAAYRGSLRRRLIGMEV
jgi:transcriptional regulator GlxA family with amidase domain